MPLCSYMIIGVNAVGEWRWVTSGTGLQIIGEKS